MKESTKHAKATNEFKEIAKSCKDSFISLADHTTTIAGNNYKCTVIIEDYECLIYEILPSSLSCSEIGRFNLN